MYLLVKIFLLILTHNSLVWGLFSSFNVNNGVDVVIFKRVDSSNGSEVLSPLAVKGTPSKVKCAAYCVSDPSCAGYDHDIILKECQLYQTTLEPSGSPLIPAVSTARYARFKGTYTPVEDCLQLHDIGFTVDGVYTINPGVDKNSSTDAYCDLVSGGWTLVQKRFDGSVDFYNPWNEYVAGFGNAATEHWLGLYYIHRLTESPTEIVFNLHDRDGMNIYAWYRNFTVLGESTKYTLMVDDEGFTGNIAELFTEHSGMMFSTYDSDNDVDSLNNCAKKYTGAWWYAFCYKMGNFNGDFYATTYAAGAIATYDATSGLAFYDKTLIRIRRLRI